MLIDTHCHLYLEEFKKDIDEVILNAQKNEVQQFFLPAINSETTEALLKLEEKFHNHCFAMMGLHPCYVKENFQDELDFVASWLKKRKFAAIGECGLDFYWDKTFIKEQYIVLEKQIEWALEYNVPLILHTRSATQETIDVIKKYKTENLKGIFHCFGGSMEEANQIIELGFYLGIGGVITYKNAGLDIVMKELDLKHIVLETDAPYLSPVPFRGKRNESKYLLTIAEKIAIIKNCSLEEIKSITTNNANKLFHSINE
jgi:TatD DNase family protein